MKKRKRLSKKKYIALIETSEADLNARILSGLDDLRKRKWIIVRRVLGQKPIHPDETHCELLARFRGAQLASVRLGAV